MRRRQLSNRRTLTRTTRPGDININAGFSGLILAHILSLRSPTLRQTATIGITLPRTMNCHENYLSTDQGQLFSIGGDALFAVTLQMC